MAGAGFKTFATGDVLTASDVNTYLMQQTVMVFASAAARTTALGANVAQGMLSYLKDSNTTAYYDGSAWQTLSTGGDITSVTAGTGISGGGTSGDVTVTNSMATAMTTKGDLVPATGSGTFARLAAGSDGSILVANSAASTGLGYTPYFAAGKNKIINGDFGIWQRGTSISLTNNTNFFTADRWRIYESFSAGTSTVTQQTFTPGTAPVTGYEGTYFARITVGSTATYFEFGQRIEDVRTFANQTATLSFWAKASTNTSVSGTLVQNFGSGGSTSVSVGAGSYTFTTSWQRFTYTVNVNSISGKTIGSGSNLDVIFASSSLTGSQTIDIWGVQLEAGSVATPFTTATGTIQGELAACQRYYYRQGGDSNYQTYGFGPARAQSQADLKIIFPVQMRVAPTSIDYSNLALNAYAGAAAYASTSVTIGSYESKNIGDILVQIGSNSLVLGAWTNLLANGTTSSYIGFNAEL